MKNHEAYKDMIIKYRDEGGKLCINFIQPYILKSDHCNNLCCEACQMLQTIWLMEEYEEPEKLGINWNEIPVDTPILVRQSRGDDWTKRHFAKYERGTVYAWCDGQTSWTTYNRDMINWHYAKLVKE